MSAKRAATWYRWDQVPREELHELLSRRLITAEIVVRAGEVLHLSGNVPHEAHALDDTLDVDVFYPPREDWLKKTDAYLRK